MNHGSIPYLFMFLITLNSCSSSRIPYKSYLTEYTVVNYLSHYDSLGIYKSEGIIMDLDGLNIYNVDITIAHHDFDISINNDGRWNVFFAKYNSY